MDAAGEAAGDAAGLAAGLAAARAFGEADGLAATDGAGLAAAGLAAGFAGAVAGAVVGVAGAVVQPTTRTRQVAPRAVTSRRGVTRPNVPAGVMGRLASGASCRRHLSRRVLAGEVFERQNAQLDRRFHRR
jgi:hypothetical protein